MGVVAGGLVAEEEIDMGVFEDSCEKHTWEFVAVLQHIPTSTLQPVSEKGVDLAHGGGGMRVGVIVQAANCVQEGGEKRVGGGLGVTHEQHGRLASSIAEEVSPAVGVCDRSGQVGIGTDHEKVFDAA